ncbi:endonuclease/exonuclease/phosphatase family protein [bacterium SCSIO 12643]|nr:endonuclease/exonuclease/phosphatase family protein [bacterium SCSIO 12643]
MKRIFLVFFTALLAGVIFFYFWGSSATLSIETYNKIYKFDDTSLTQKDTFSILTYNLGYLSGMTNNLPLERTDTFFSQNLNSATRLIQQLQPDIIAFQEIDFDAHRSFHVNQMLEISQKNQFPYAAQAINWDKTYVPFPYWPFSLHFGKVVSGQAVLSVYPILKNEIHVLAKPEENPFYYNAFYLDRLAQLSVVEINKQPLVIINVHLEAFHSNTRNIQVKKLLELFHVYSEKYPVILCGDFNSTPPNASDPWQDDHVIQTLLADYQMEMAIGLSENQQNENRYFTFSSASPSKRIDYFFYNPKFIQFIDARVVSEAGTISDHLPVRMKFTLR